MELLQTELGDRFKPADLLQEHAGSEKPFYDEK